MRVRLAVVVLGAGLVVLTACGSTATSGSITTPPMAGGTATVEPSAGGTATVEPSAARSTSGSGSSAGGACGLLTASELSSAVGVTYTRIEGVNGGTLCNVTGAASTDSFSYSVTRQDAANTWDSQVAAVQQDDGSASEVSGIGDRAVQGAVKEFAAESGGSIVVVLNADVNNPATAADFTRSKAIALALISRI